MSSLDLLQSNYEVGDRLKADDINALIDWAKQYKSTTGFLSDNVTVPRYKPQSKKVFHLKNTTGEAIKPFSVFGIFSGGSSSSSSAMGGVPEGNAKQFSIDPSNSTASTFVFVTNGSTEIPVNAGFEAEFISFNKPTLVRASANDIPEVGEPCGISFGEMRVGTQTNGLICLTPSFVEGDEVYIFVCRSREPIKVTGCVTSKITRAVKVGGKILAGSGQLQVVYRNQFNLIDSVNRPAFPQTSRWNLKVFNYSEIEYPAGMMLSATDTLGVGLTVDYEQENKLCLGSSSSSSRSSRSSLSSSSFSSRSSSSSSLTFSQCCFAQRGAFWVGGILSPSWPSNLILSMPGACCANFKGPFVLSASDPAPFGLNVFYEFASFSFPRCDGTTINFSISLQCNTGALFGAPSYGFAMGFAGEAPGALFPGQVTILNCNPFHAQFTMTVANPFGHWCNGTFLADITE